MEKLEKRSSSSFRLLGLTAVMLASAVAFSVARFRGEAVLVEHSYQVLSDLSRLAALTTRAESNVRAYFASGDQAFLTVFAEARKNLIKRQESLSAQVADNPGQLALVRELLTTTDARMRHLASAAAHRQRGESMTQIEVLHGEEGRFLIASLDDLNASIQAAEERLLRERRSAREATEFVLLLLCLVGTLVSVGLVITGNTSLKRYQTARMEAQQELLRVNAELEQRVLDRTRSLEAANAELMSTTRALRRSNTELESFAYAATHDLQEPLRTITAFAQLLERRHGEAVSDEGRFFLKTIIEASSRMSALISGLLEYSRVSSEQVDRTERVRLAEIVETVQQNLTAQIAESGAEIVIRGPLPELPGSRMQLLRLMQNLIANAIRYRSEDRTSRIEISAVRQQQWWAVTVRDNGTGFNPDYSRQIFGMFKRLDRSRSGAGVGLAISQKIVNQYGGEIRAEGVEGTGASFTFTWPATLIDVQASSLRY